MLKFDMEHYLDLGKNVGFMVTEKEINGETFFFLLKIEIIFIF